MTGHKSNSNLKPLIRLREVFYFFLSRMRGRKKEKVEKQWDLLVKVGGTMVYHFSNEASEQVGQVWARVEEKNKNNRLGEKL